MGRLSHKWGHSTEVVELVAVVVFVGGRVGRIGGVCGGVCVGRWAC